MELFLMRHAEAESPALYTEDRQRPLTERGCHSFAPFLRYHGRALRGKGHDARMLLPRPRQG
jgi:phosphohistidine phosphatase SixA